MQAKLELTEKKQKEKMTTWQEMKENEKHNDDTGKRMFLLDESQLRQEMAPRRINWLKMDPNEIYENVRSF